MFLAGVIMEIIFTGKHNKDGRNDVTYQSKLEVSFEFDLNYYVVKDYNFRDTNIVGDEEILAKTYFSNIVAFNVHTDGVAGNIYKILICYAQRHF